MRRFVVCCLILVVFCPGAFAGGGVDSGRPDEERVQLAQRDPARENREPFKIFDNLYYVGINWVSAYVIPTSEGLILIDALYGEYVDHLIEGVKKVGYDPRDVKYVFVTHAHFDHVGGAPRIKELSGARVGMTEADWDFLKEFEENGQPQSPPMERDLVIQDGDTITLGDTTMTFYVTPGHTPGVLSMEFTVKDGAKEYKAFCFGGVGLNFSGVERTEMYIDSVKRIQGMEGIEVNVPNHAMMGNVFERGEDLKDRKPGEPHPFVAPEEFSEWLDELLVNAEKKLVREKR